MSVSTALLSIIFSEVQHHGDGDNIAGDGENSDGDDDDLWQ